MWNRRGALCLEQCSYREKRNSGVDLKQQQSTKRKREKQKTGTEEKRSQGTYSLRHQDLSDKGKRMLEDSYKEYTLHLSSS